MSEIVKEGENNKDIGIIGPKIYRYNQRNIIDFTGADINPYILVEKKDTDQERMIEDSGIRICSLTKLKGLVC